MTQDLCHLLAQLENRLVDYDIFKKLANFPASRIHTIDHIFCLFGRCPSDHINISSCRYILGVLFIFLCTCYSLAGPEWS